MIETVIAFKRLDERDDAILVDVPDADPVSPAHMVGGARLGVDRVEHVVIGDENPADPAIHIPRFEVVAVLVEDFEAMVAPVCDPQASL